MRTSQGFTQDPRQKCDCCPHYAVQSWDELEQWRRFQHARKARAERDRALWQRVAERKREARKRKRFDEEKEHAWLLSHTGKLSIREQRIREELLRKRARREEARSNPIVLDDDEDDSIANPARSEEHVNVKVENGALNELANLEEEPVHFKVEDLAEDHSTISLPTPPPSGQSEEQAYAAPKTIIIDLGDEEDEESIDEAEFSKGVRPQSVQLAAAYRKL